MREETVGRSKTGITGNERYSDNTELGDFLLRECKQRRLSLRSLSINSGLSPSTVAGIIKRKYQPSLFLLNRLADYLGIKRAYLWQLVGLLQDMDYDTETTFGDPRLRFQLARADKLPEVNWDCRRGNNLSYQRADNRPAPALSRYEPSRDSRRCWLLKTEGASTRTEGWTNQKHEARQLSQ